MKSTEETTNQDEKILNMNNAQSESEATIAKQVIAFIKDEDDLSAEVKRRLVESRQLAVNRLIAMQTGTHAVADGGVLQWLGDHFNAYLIQHRAIATAFALMLVTFFAFQQFVLNDNIENSDAYLLASDLPPEAFADKGFNTWIASARN